ncbi:MAG: hypothetical protein ACR652_18565 [Methylocystis sp.]|uniref:hypothetical protein n=1 Tax=Methylocystis sp. TaxID=1911079 RepID=UPI003DA55C1C
MITLSIDEKDVHVLRVSASYLLALAGDISTSIVGSDGRPLLTDADALADLNGTARPDWPTNTPPPEPATFNAAEHVEAEALAGYHTGGPFPGQGQPTPPDPAAVFGGGQIPPPQGASAPSIAGVEASTIAPEDTTAITSIPTPPSVPAPPVATPESAAVPVVPQTPAPAPGVELDKNGLPWDNRIHSREKTKTKDGAWKYKRGVADNVIADVEQELRAVMAVPAVPAPPPLPPATPASAPLEATGSTAATPPGSTVTPASPSNTFAELMQRVTQAVAAGKLSESQTLQACTAAGLPGIPALMQRPDLIPTVSATIEKAIAEAGGL